MGNTLFSVPWGHHCVIIDKTLSLCIMWRFVLDMERLQKSHAAISFSMWGIAVGRPKSFFRLQKVMECGILRTLTFTHIVEL